MNDVYIEICEKHDVPYKLDYNFGKFSYSRTGFMVRIALFPINSQQLASLITDFQKQTLSFKVLGNTTNVLFLDSLIYKCFIYTKMLHEYKFLEDHVVVDCGRSVSDFVRDISMRGITGFEGLEGIPGSIGGALVMNAGAYGYTITDNLVSVDVIDENGKITSITKSKLSISNRSIPTLDGKVILRAKFFLKKGVHRTIEKLTRKYHISRHQYQEWVYPNLGSIYIVPGLNINQTMRQIYTQKNLPLKLLYFFLFKLWFSKPMFLVRRTFPSFNGPFELLRILKIKTYTSEIASKTTVNTFANKNYSTLEILQYFRQLHKDAKGNIRLENEIHTENLDEVVDKKLHHLQLKILEKIQDDNIQV